MTRGIEDTKKKDRVGKTATSHLVPALKGPLHLSLYEKLYQAKFSMSRMDTYTGNSNPKDHLNMYVTFMKAPTQRDDILCRAFSGTLRGVAYC